MDESFAVNRRRNRPDWRRSARHGVAMALGVLVVLGGAGQVLGATAPAALPSPTSARQEDERAEATRPDRATGDSTAEILNRHGAQGLESLQAVAAVDIANPYPATVNLEATRVAEAQAAATQTAVAEAAMTATAEARRAAADATATAAAAVELRHAEATATAEARTERMAAVRATLEAGNPTPAAVVATAPSQARTSSGVDRMSLVSLALLPVLSGALGIRLWRRHKEPFAIKAKPAKG